MADSGSESNVQSDTFGLRKIGSSLFGIPGFLGHSSKASSESDTIWSPTSPLDFRAFVNLSNPFSARTPKCSSQNCHKKKWGCSKVGLGIINSLAEERKSPGDVVGSLNRKNIVFGPVKFNTLNFLGNGNEPVYTFKKSNSLPRNYLVPPILVATIPNLQSGCSNGDLEQEDVRLELESFKSSLPCSPASTRLSSSLTGSVQSQNLSPKQFYSAGRPIVRSASMAIGQGAQVETYSGPKSSSPPAVIDTGEGSVSSLSASEIEQSEDYTCIISHGPDSRTTHIFCDCVLEGPIHELVSFDKQGVEPPQVAKHLECLTASSSVYPSDDFLSFCYLCKKKLDKGKDIYMYRGEKAFCSFECRAEEILADEEEEENCNNSSESSPALSYSEGFFVLGLPTVCPPLHNGL